MSITAFVILLLVASSLAEAFSGRAFQLHERYESQMMNSIYLPAGDNVAQSYFFIINQRVNYKRVWVTYFVNRAMFLTANYLGLGEFLKNNRVVEFIFYSKTLLMPVCHHIRRTNTNGKCTNRKYVA